MSICRSRIQTYTATGSSLGFSSRKLRLAPRPDGSKSIVQGQRTKAEAADGSARKTATATAQTIGHLGLHEAKSRARLSSARQNRNRIARSVWSGLRNGG